MRKQHQFRLPGRDKLFERVNVSVRGIGLKRSRFQVIYLFDLVPSQFLRHGGCVETGQNQVNWPSRFLADALGGGKGLQRNAVQLTLPLLRDGAGDD